MKINDILQKDNNSVQSNEFNIELFKTQYITFSDLYLYYNDDDFLELLFNSIDEGRCEIETNLNDFDIDQLTYEIRSENLSRSIKFIISIECDDKYLIVSNIAERSSNNSYLTTKILNVIIKLFNEQLKEYEQEENDRLNWNELSTYISKIHNVDNQLITNVKLKNGETIFCSTDNAYNLESEEIDLNLNLNLNIEQDNDDNFLVDPSELSEDEYQRNNVEGSPDDEDETENNDENNNTNDLEILKDRLTEYQFEQIEILINLLNQDLNYTNVLSHATDLNYI